MRFAASKEINRPEDSEKVQFKQASVFWIEMKRKFGY